MKKILVAILVLAMLFSLSACCVPLKDTDDLSSQIAPQLTDDTIIFCEGSISANANIQFKDQDGNVVLTASDIKTVAAKQLDGDGYALQLTLTENGAQKFATVTSQNLGKTISIIIDGEVIMDPTVVDAITNGEFVITNIESKEKLLNLYESLTNPTVPTVATLPLTTF